MKHLLSALAFCAALPVCAQETSTSTSTLTVNASPTKTAQKDDHTFTFEGPESVEVAGGMAVLLDATMTFTLPSEDSATPSAEDKISIMANKDGEILISNGTAWAKSGVTVKDYESKHVKIATVQKEGALAFDVTIEGMDTPITVAPTAGGTEFSTLAFEGEGAVNGVAVAAVPTAIIPSASGEGGTQDAALVSKYVTWLNDADKGGAMPEGASDTALSDAFAMNVGGTPSLAITAITPPTDGQAGSITVAGSYVPASADGTAVQAEAQPAPLDAINGTLYITYASELGGKATTKKVEISAADDETKTVITLPEGAVFVKARVALTQPTDTTL